MKSFLKKRWCGIPVGIVSIILALVLVGGGVLAAYLVWQRDFPCQVVEPITVEVTDEFTEPMYPGLGTQLAAYIVTNTGPVGLPITATWPGQEGPVSCYATIRYCDADGTLIDPNVYITQVDYTGTATFNLPSGGSAKIQLGVLIFADAPPGAYNFHVTISRG